jgi:DNA-binding response OmpR family regulator
MKESKRIVVADDDRAVVSILKKVLTENGYELKTANDGGTALELIKDFKPHLVMLDVMMPVIDGYHLCQAVAENPKFQPAPKMIIMTVRKDELDKRISEFAGADIFISKPFDIQEVLEIVKKLLES